MNIEQDKLDKLPKWAQRHIYNLTRQCDAAVERLHKFEDTQTPSNIWYDDSVYEKGRRDSRQYVQSGRVIVSHKGVELEVSTRSDEGIQLRWGTAGCRHSLGTIAFVPTSYQQARLVNLVYDEDELARLKQAKQGDERATRQSSN